MGYVVLRQVKVGASVLQPGDQPDTATVDSWPSRDAYLASGIIRYVADAQAAQFITDLTGGATAYLEGHPGKDGADYSAQKARGQRVR